MACSDDTCGVWGRRRYVLLCGLLGIFMLVPLGSGDAGPGLRALVASGERCLGGRRMALGLTSDRDSRWQRRLGLVLVGLLGLVAWRLETPWRRLQAEYLDRVLDRSRAELAVLRAASAEDLRFLEGEVEVARDRLPAREIADAERRLLALERKLARSEPGTGGRRPDRAGDWRTPLGWTECSRSFAQRRLGWRTRADRSRGWRNESKRSMASGAGCDGSQCFERWVQESACESSFRLERGRLERCVTCHLSMTPGSAVSRIVRDCGARPGGGAPLCASSPA